MAKSLCSKDDYEQRVFEKFVESFSNQEHDPWAHRVRVIITILLSLKMKFGKDMAKYIYDVFVCIPLNLTNVKLRLYNHNWGVANYYWNVGPEHGWKKENHTHLHVFCYICRRPQIDITGRYYCPVHKRDDKCTKCSHGSCFNRKINMYCSSIPILSGKVLTHYISGL